MFLRLFVPSFYILASFYFTYELMFGDIDLGVTGLVAYPASAVINLTFFLFLPHIIFGGNKLVDRHFEKSISEETMTHMSASFEIGYIIVAGFVLLTWCVKPGTEHAEPIFVLVSVSFATFEYRELLFRRLMSIHRVPR